MTAKFLPLLLALILRLFSLFNFWFLPLTFYINYQLCRKPLLYLPDLLLRYLPRRLAYLSYLPLPQLFLVILCSYGSGYHRTVFPAYVTGVFKRGEAPLFNIFPLSCQGRGIKGVGSTTPTKMRGWGWLLLPQKIYR